MSKVTKKSKNLTRSDYLLKIGVFLFFVGLIIMMLATYISFVNS